MSLKFLAQVFGEALHSAHDPVPNSSIVRSMASLSARHMPLSSPSAYSRPEGVSSMSFSLPSPRLMCPAARHSRVTVFSVVLGISSSSHICFWERGRPSRRA